MKHLKTFTLVLAFITGAAFISCEEDDGDENLEDNCYEHLADLSETLSEKSTAFSNNPNPSTCGAVRTAAINLLEAAEDCDSAGQYQQATQYWINLDCSEFN